MAAVTLMTAIKMFLLAPSTPGFCGVLLTSQAEQLEVAQVHAEGAGGEEEAEEKGQQKRAARTRGSKAARRP